MRVAIITGGTRGIGKGIAEALAETGDFEGFVLTYNTNKEAAEAVRDELLSDTKHVKKVMVVGGDLTLESMRAAIFECFDKEFNGESDYIGCMVHNAGQMIGVTSDNANGMGVEKRQKFGDGSLLDEHGNPDLTNMRYYQKLYGEAFIDLCERSIYRMKKARQRMVAMNHGSKKFRASIVGISSPGCNAAFKVTPGYDMPGSGKSLMEYSIRQYALQVAPLGINCNVVIPGITESDAWEKIAETQGSTGNQFLERMRPNIPMNEITTAKEIGDVVAHLSGRGGGRFMTGLSLRVDGGLHLK